MTIARNSFNMVCVISLSIDTYQVVRFDIENAEA